MQLLRFVWAAASASAVVLRLTDGSYAPNHFLGTCLTKSWVSAMEAELGVSSTARDTDGRLAYPFLQPALQYPRYTVDDPRTASAEAYTEACMSVDPSMRIFGVGATMGDGRRSGRVNGTLVLDMRSWDTQKLVSIVLSILAQEVVGYEVSFFKGSTTFKTAQRMSSVGEGVCVPTHMNLEVWPAGIKAGLDMYSNVSYNVGGIGFSAIAGIYTTNDFVAAGFDDAQFNPNIFANYWKHYQADERVINAVNASHFFGNSKYYPPAEDGCTENDNLGCRDSCARSEACTRRKEESDDNECLMIVMMYSNYDRGYFQAVLSNLGISAYFCFIGYESTLQYALEAQQNGSAVLFYHSEPDMFFINYPGLFQRVTLPRSLPSRVALSTGTYGENGYGNATNNPVDVDYPQTMPVKYAASLLGNLPIVPVLSKLTLTDIDIINVLEKLKDALDDDTVPDPNFEAACGWVKENYNVWRLWIDRLPLCDFDTHISNTVSGCNSSYRQIDFKWNVPNPDNSSLPFVCDGGYAALPDPLITSRSCEWVAERESIWVNWIASKPECDSSFYEYYVTDCDSSATRTIKFQWLLPLSSDVTYSAECESGVTLPKDIVIDCEYMPESSPAVAAVGVLAGIEFILLTVALFYVYIHRDAPIIKRSQYELLMVMLFGCFFIAGAAVAYAGRPTDTLCGLRPILISFGFTSVFGSLVVKSLRVYRVFMQKTMKRTTITLRMMLKVLVYFYVIDIAIFVSWGVADYPSAETHEEFEREAQGPVSRIACRSSSFIFTALLMFWKAILLFSGLYLSFLIRKVSVDFQESTWIFASALVVLFACFVILPLAYLVDMQAAVFYVFLAAVLLLCTAAVVAFMFIPKVLRIKEVESASKLSGFSGASSNEMGAISSSTTTAAKMKYAVKPSISQSPSGRMNNSNRKISAKPTKVPVGSAGKLLQDKEGAQ